MEEPSDGDAHVAVTVLYIVALRAALDKFPSLPFLHLRESSFWGCFRGVISTTSCFRHRETVHSTTESGWFGSAICRPWRGNGL